MLEHKRTSGCPYKYTWFWQTL